MKRRMTRWLGIILLGSALGARAQQYTGTTGLLHVPSAEMESAGTARIGAHFLNRELTPAAFTYNGKYHTASYYLNLTPFPWIELAYTCTLLREEHKDGGTGLTGQDRYFSVKIRPLKEGRWWPSVAIGSNDPYGSGYKGMLQVSADSKSQYFCNYYVAAAKHVGFKAGELGVHAAYRRFKQDYNGKWNGVVGGLTFRPAFARSLRAVVEYTGHEVNAGVDCLLWRHLLVQACLQGGKYFSGGLCYQLNLF